MSDEEVERLGERIEVFLNDEAIQTAFRRLRERYFAEFCALKDATPEALVSIKAKASVLDDFQTELRSLADAGKRIKIERQRREVRRAR